MKFTKLLFMAVLILVVLNAGCVGFWRDSYKDLTSTPGPSATVQPSVTSMPVNQTIERQYLYVDKLDSALDNYNNGIAALNESKRASQASDWTNASLDIQAAQTFMEQARNDFIGMRAYAATSNEMNLSNKWNDTTYFYMQAFYYANLSYQESAYQAGRSTPNYIKQNYYVQQANFYSQLAQESREEAIAIERSTFLGQ